MLNSRKTFFILFLFPFFTVYCLPITVYLFTVYRSPLSCITFLTGFRLRITDFYDLLWSLTPSKGNENQSKKLNAHASSDQQPVEIHLKRFWIPGRRHDIVKRITGILNLLRDLFPRSRADNLRWIRNDGCPLYWSTDDQT